MGSLLGEAILDFPGDLEVIATGKPAFFEAAKVAVEATPRQGQPGSLGRGTFKNSNETPKKAARGTC